MPEDESDSWEVRLLKANATEDYMAEVLADCIRNCMRGVASGDSSSAVFRASQDFAKLIKLIKYTETRVSVMQLFADAIDEIRPNCMEDIGNKDTFFERYVDISIFSAASSGIQYIVERSCADNAAKGRASRRKSEFLGSLRHIKEAQEERSREWKQRRVDEQASRNDATNRVTPTAKVRIRKSRKQPVREDPSDSDC